MIEVRDLTKRYGDKLAVDGLSFQVRPGRITGFLGPNGAGKSTTMRLILGLDAPTGGQASVNGRPYRLLAAPLREAGSLLEARAVHGGRTAYHHLLYLAQSNGIGRRRIAEVLDLVGLAAVAGRRAKGFSLGMSQRLGIAAALLGDPGVLILDEPVNGLDTDGIRWIRGLLKSLAAQGRTVFLSSHLMSEMELTADHLIVIGQGRLIADIGMRQFIERNSYPFTLVRSPQPDRLTAVLQESGAQVRLDPDGALRISGIDTAMIGDIANAHHVPLHELTARLDSLEDVYTRMTGVSVEYRGGTGITSAGLPAPGNQE
ncbi:ATP-binding cassette domain-containing protein [Micromonospora echinospora]